MMTRLFVLATVSLFLIASTPTRSIDTVEDMDIPIHERWMDRPLTRKNLALALVDAGVQHPDIVYKQALLESRHLKSGLCKDGNNLFGMKKPRSRKTYAKKQTVYGHAAFDHWIYSVMDYKIWQGNEPIDNYFRFLKKRNYASNEQYISLLKGIFIRDSIRQIFEDQPKVM